jgi:uncharacterized protein (TIGR02145 family)
VPDDSVSLTTQVASDNSGGTYTFLNHNLGADTSLDPHTPVKGLNGDYYQWGRNLPAADVDNIIGTWGSQGGTSSNGNWTPNAKGLQDPCPDGYRVPSQPEWAAVSTSNTPFRTGLPWSESTTEFGNALHYGPDTCTKLLTLPATGYREDGTLKQRGIYGGSWSSTEYNDTNSFSLRFSDIGVFPGNIPTRVGGLPVRCIAQ